MDAEAVNILLDFFAKRPAVMRSFASGGAGWHELLLFYSNALFAFDGITSLLETHLQEPWPKRNLAEGPEAATLVDDGAHQQLFCDVAQKWE